MAGFIYALVISSAVLAQAPSAPAGQGSSVPPVVPGDTSARTAPLPPPAVTAPQFLDRAKQILTGINGESLPKDAQKTLAQLRIDFDAMAVAYAASVASPQVPPALVGEERGPTDWQTRFSDVERNLALLVGGGSTVVTQPPPSAAGTLDVPDISQLSPGTSESSSRPTLEGFRTQLELFYDAATRLHPVIVD